MSRTSGFRPPGRDYTHGHETRRTKRDHASKAYQEHLIERFRARERERADESAESETEPGGGGAEEEAGTV